MNKISSLIVTFCLITIAGIYWTWQQTQQQTQSQNFILFPSVKGCAETESGMSTKALGQTEREPKIEVDGNEILYSRAINHLCCRKVEIEKEIENSINIYEVWSGIGCKCICFSEIEARIKNVPPGNYTVNVYEKGTEPGGEPMEQKLIISKNVVI
jgi:hypothetical protein